VGVVILRVTVSFERHSGWGWGWGILRAPSSQTDPLPNNIPHPFNIFLCSGVWASPLQVNTIVQSINHRWLCPLYMQRGKKFDGRFHFTSVPITLVILMPTAHQHHFIQVSTWITTLLMLYFTTGRCVPLQVWLNRDVPMTEAQHVP